MRFQVSLCIHWKVNRSSNERDGQDCCNECGLFRSCDPVVKIGQITSINLSLLNSDTQIRSEGLTKKSRVLE